MSVSNAMPRLIEQFSQRLLSHIEHDGFDVVHAHDWVTFRTAHAVAEKLGVPWIAHFHSTEEERRPRLPDMVIKGIERTAVKTASRIVTPSEVTKGAVLTQYETTPDEISVVPNCLSEEAVDPFCTGDFEAKNVVFLGRLTSQKGPDLFARIAEIVRRGEPNTTFPVYGDGELLKELERERAPLELYGALKWERRKNAFASASVLVVPSVAEPFGMVVLEAMQHGVPVVCTKNAGVTEVISSIKKSNPGDPQSTANVVLSLLHDWHAWHAVLEAQDQEIKSYPERKYEVRLVDLWKALADA